MDKETERNSGNAPIPAPRSKTKPAVRPTKPSVNSSASKKPPIAAKPKISPKPSLEPKSAVVTPTKTDSTEQPFTKENLRPLSIKVTDDGMHNKVANELSSILSKPRTTPKGLLSPTKYSSESDSESPHGSSNAGQKEASHGSISPTKPLPRPRQPVTSESDVTSPLSPIAHAGISTEHEAPLDKDADVKKSPPSRPPPPARPPRPQQVPAPAVKTALPLSQDNKVVSSAPTCDNRSSDPPRTQPEVKKKLEITVLGARPMSEVGFRDVKSQPTLPTQVSSNSKPPAAANIALKNDSNGPPLANNNSSINVDKTSTSAPPRKPTIIRPTRRPANDHHSDTDSLVVKENGFSSKATTAHVRGSVPPPKPYSSTATPIPPSSLPVKKDPWNQIAKGPGPTDNLAFSSGDTPPPRAHTLTLLSSLTPRQDESTNELSNAVKDTVVTPRTNSPARPPAPRPTKTIIDQSLESTTSNVLNPTPTTSPEDHMNKPAEPSMFFHTGSSEPAPTGSKPSALQRIYEAKRAREEKNPEKYKHRPDCYVDKPNIDMSFWKPSAHSPDEHVSGPGTDTKQSGRDTGSNNKDTSLIAYAAFAYKATDPADLTLKAGQEVRVLGKVDKEWLYGEADGQSGTFPALYVSVSEDDIDDLPLHKPSPQPASTTALSGRALYDFTAEHDSELSLKVGNRVMSVEPVDGEWSVGTIGEQRGIFPTAFVRLDS